MPKHTEIPWRVQGDHIMAMAAMYVAKLSVDIYPTAAERAANAEYIVEAANNYERLKSDNETLHSTLSLIAHSTTPEAHVLRECAFRILDVIDNQEKAR